MSFIIHTQPPLSPRRLSTSPASYDLKNRAIKTLEALYNSPASAPKYISPDVLIERDDAEPVTSHQAFSTSWGQTLANMPDFQLEVSEAVADESQRKVWIRSEVTGFPDGKRRESVDMMEFSEEGYLISTSGYWRTMKNKHELEVEE